jgi:hypothetical protein
MSNPRRGNPGAVTVGDERFAPVGAEPVVTTTAERYVMSGGRAERLAVKEDELFLYTNALGHAPGA